MTNNKFIDREREQHLFKELLKRENDARLLAICDGGGMGKSELLRQFRYHCGVMADIPVSLISFAELDDQTPWGLMQKCYKQLTEMIDFPYFEKFRKAYSNCDFTSISGLGQVNMQGSNLNQAQYVEINAVKFNAETINYQNQTTTFTPEQKSMAQEQGVTVFWQELTAMCHTQTVVILLDAYEQVKTPDLATWLMTRLFKPYCFNLQRRPPRLLWVIAGRTLPPFHDYVTPHIYEQVAKPIPALHKWEREHLVHYFQQQGYAYQPDEVDKFHNLIVNNAPLGSVLNAMQLHCDYLPKKA